MDIWRHGRYVDLWSVVHLLSGAVLAVGCYWLGYGFWTAAIVSFALLAAWEVFEWVIGIIEPTVNVAVDIVLGLAGFLLGAYWHYSLGNTFDALLFGSIAFVTFALSAWGFLDFYFRGYR